MLAWNRSPAWIRSRHAATASAWPAGVGVARHGSWRTARGAVPGARGRWTAQARSQARSARPSVHSASNHHRPSPSSAASGRRTPAEGAGRQPRGGLARRPVRAGGRAHSRGRRTSRRRPRPRRAASSTGCRRAARTGLRRLRRPGSVRIRSARHRPAQRPISANGRSSSRTSSAAPSGASGQASGSRTNDVVGLTGPGAHRSIVNEGRT